jgi:hypothetical protein
MNRHRYPVKTTLALAIAASAAFPAAASAHTDVPPQGDKAFPVTQQVPVLQVSSNGFDWSDAGIGAAGGLGISMIALGGGLVLVHRRGHGTARGPAHAV